MGNQPQRARESAGAPEEAAAAAAGAVERGPVEGTEVRPATPAPDGEPEALLRSVINNLPGTVVYQIEARPGGTRRFTFLSDAVAELFGCSPQEALADPARVYGRFHEDDRARIAQEEERALAALTPFRSEIRVHRPAGDVGWIHAASSPRRRADGTVVWDGVITDITERKRIEAALRESEAVARRRLAEIDSLYASAGVGLCVLDRDLRFVRVNDRLAEMNGVPAAAHVGRTLREVAPGLAEQGEAVARHVLETRRPVTDLEISGTTPAQPGVVRTWIEHWLPLRNESGEIAGVSVVADEITDRKRAEASLRQATERLQESELRYRSLVELAPEAVLVHRDRRIVFANAEGQRLFGAAAAERLLGRDIVDFVHPDDRESSVRRIEAASAGERTPLREFRLRTLDGREVVAEASGKGIRYEGRAAVLVILRDVTERRHAEEALRRSREEYRHIVEGSGSVILKSDPALRITFMNEFGLRFFGYSREEIVGRSAVGTIIPLQDEQGRDVGAMAADLARRPEAYRTNVHQNRRKDGSLVWMSWANNPIYDEQGRLVELLVVGTDLSRLKEAEHALHRRQEELRESEARFRTLAQALPQIVFDAAADGTVEYVNERWAEYTGCAPGMREDRLVPVHPDDRERILVSWRQAVQTGRAYECEHRLRRRDGQYRWMLARGLPMAGADGRPARWLGTLTDIHDLKQAQEVLREADQRKTEFLAVLSHELRNPLAPVRQGLYVLARAQPGGEQAGKALAVVERQVSHLARLVDDLLDVTRITRGKIELQRGLLELGGLVRRTLEDHRASLEAAGLRLEGRFEPGPLWVNADAARVVQALSNLLANAEKFTPRGGSVAVGVQREGREVAVRVVDTGVGVPAEVMRHLFVPFAQAPQTMERARGGLGLGLAMVKGLVELHGGSVDLASDGPGRGTAVTMRLPLEAAPAPEAADEQPAPARPRRVLVIEDNEDAADSLRDALSLGGHEVEAAYDGPRGLELARAFRPEIVVCDIGLPGMDGYEVARAFRADPALRGVYLVALTGYAMPEDFERAGAAGFDRHVPKPPALDELDRLLREAPAASSA